MVEGIGGATGRAVTGDMSTPAAGTVRTSFADVLKASIDEVERLQTTASRAVEDVAMGKTSDIDMVITEVEMADMAFKTLLAVRAKLMEAYNEIKNLGI